MKKQSPCSICPFRFDVDFPLAPGAFQTVLLAFQGDGEFPCYNTLDKPPCPIKACVGAAIFLEHARIGGLRENRYFRMREGLPGEFTRDELGINSPVFRDVASFVAAKLQLLK